MSRKAGRGALSAGFRIVFAVAILLASGPGCLGRGAKGPPSPMPGDAEDFVTRIEEPEPPPEAAETAEDASAPAVAGETEKPVDTEEDPGPSGAAESPPSESPPASGGPQAAEETGPAPSAAPAEAALEREPPPEHGGGPAPRARAAPGKATAKPKPHPAAPAIRSEVPGWAMGKEILVYRVEFLGMTMGYARFTFRGKVSVRGKDAYLLNVRAWTSDFLSVIYPVNDSIDYYLDAETLAPLRLEFSRPAKEKDDVAIYDQENGKLVYRYKRTGEIRKQVDIPRETYDPVSVAYYFRARDLGAEERPRHVYGGRKVWQISSRMLGRERIAVNGTPFDTVIIQPIMRREGKVTDRGDVRMWLTNDARHVPVRIFAKFKKIREWTLHAELMPPQEGG